MLYQQIVSSLLQVVSSNHGKGVFPVFMFNCMTHPAVTRNPRFIRKLSLVAQIAPIMQHAPMTNNPQFSSSFGNSARSHRSNQFPPSRSHAQPHRVLKSSKVDGFVFGFSLKPFQMQAEVYGKHNNLQANLLESSTAPDPKVVGKRLQHKTLCLNTWFLDQFR